MSVLDTYFASPISWGATPHNWKTADSFAAAHGLLFAPSVGPGYVDTRVRPWNVQATKARTGNGYYDNEWKSAIAANARWIGITSFNEWHEGTQIEPASQGKRDGVQGFSYEEYKDGPDMYLDATRKWVQKFDPTMSTGHVPGPGTLFGR